MIAISGIGSILNQYQNISSGKKISSSSDDPGGFSISQKMKSQINGISKGLENGQYASDLLKTAEGGASGIGDQLQRMKELAIQASNGTLTDSDKKQIQSEITQIKDGIKDAANQTQFNTQKLINGNFVNKNIVLGANGEGREISVKGLNLEDLGIEDFDVTKEFDMSTVDKAIEKVSDTRVDIGSMENRLKVSDNAGRVIHENISESASKLEDSDLAKEMLKMQSKQILDQFKLNMQKTKMEEVQNSKRGIGVLYGAGV